MGVRLFRKIKELSPFASQTRGSDSSCLSHELVSGDVAFSLHLPQQGPRGGHSYGFSVCCLVGCDSALEICMIKELTRCFDLGVFCLF